MNSAAMFLLYYIASSVIALVAFPLSWWYFARLARHRFVLGRFLGLLLTNYLVWMLSSLGILKFDLAGILISLVVVGVIGIALARRNGLSVETLRNWLREHRRSILFDEFAFLFAFILFAVFVSFQPKIFGTEKNMDFMFINGLLRAEEMPPHDPWFAGETINYYYGGYMIVALIGKLAIGIPPAYLYNLSLAFFFSGVFVLSWALGREISGSRLRGSLAPLTLLIMGNLHGFLQLFQVGRPDRINYWASSRVIRDGPGGGETINEFPFFSFYHGDLHPHVIGIVFVILFSGVLYDFLFAFRPDKLLGGQFRALGLPTFGKLVLLAICLGSLGFINGLDLPTFAFLFALSVAAMALRASGFSLSMFSKSLLFAIGVIAVGGALAYLTFLPFHRGFIAPTHEQGLIGWSQYRSNPGEFLIVFHLQLLLSGIFVAISLRRTIGNLRPELKQLLAWFTIGIFVAAFAASGYLIASLLIVLLLACLCSLAINLRRIDRLFTGVRLFVAVAILVGCEFVFLRDDYGVKRMNTLFKLHFQAWILFGLCAPAVVRMLSFSEMAESTRRFLRTVVIILLCLNLVYPLGVSWKRIAQSRGAQTLDGLAYLRREHPPEAAAIEWINENIEGTPVILEYPGRDAYSYHSRVSTNTGLPTLIGWLNHENLWRKKWFREVPQVAEEMGKTPGTVANWEAVRFRQQQAERIYRETDPQKVLPVIEQYNIEYIYVGELERQNYPAEGLAKFDQIGKRVYDHGGVVIYEIG